MYLALHSGLSSVTQSVSHVVRKHYERIVRFIQTILCRRANRQHIRTEIQIERRSYGRHYSRPYGCKNPFGTLGNFRVKTINVFRLYFQLIEHRQCPHCFCLAMNILYPYLYLTAFYRRYVKLSAILLI